MMSHRSRPARVAMAAAALTFAAPSTSLAANTVFGGSTTGGDAIALTADKKAAKLKSAVIAWVAPCDDGMRFPVSLNVTAVKPDKGFESGPRDLAVTRNAKGRFTGTQTGARDLGEQVAVVSTKLAGKLRRGKASGTLSAARHRIRQGHQRAPLQLLGPRPLVRDELPGTRVRRGDEPGGADGRALRRRAAPGDRRARRLEDRDVRPA